MEMNFKTAATNNEGILCVHITSDEYEKFQLLQQQILEKKLQFLGKRAFDILVSFVLIFLLSPVLIIITILIKLTSRGPAFYSNERVGLYGMHFNCYKFRSMVSNHTVKHDDHKKAIKGQEAGILHKSKTDSRITFIGKIIRKSKY